MKPRPQRLAAATATLALLAGVALWAPRVALAQNDTAWARWGTLWNAGDTEAALAMGEQAVQSTDLPAEAVAWRAQLAVNYAVVGKHDRARQLIAEAGERTGQWRFRSLNDGGVSGYWRRHAEHALARAQCHLAITLRSLDEGQRHCQQALARARRTAELVNFGPGAADTASLEITSLLDIARLQRASGRHAAARPLVDAAEQLVRDHRVGTGTSNYFLRVASTLASEAGDHARAVALAEQAVANRRAASRTPDAAPLLQARVTLHEVLVIGQDWEAARRELDGIDATMGNRRGGRVRPSLLAQALTDAHAGRLGRLQAQLSAGAANWRARLGPEHPQTALMQGLHGAAIVAAARDDEGRARGRLQLAAASALLLEAMRQSDPYLDGSLEGQAARWVLEAFLQAQQQGQPGPGEFQLAFRVADVLRGSKVQAAMQDAALRMAGAAGPLGELVRGETELRTEIRALGDQLTGRTDSAAEATRSRLAELQLQRQALRSRIAGSYPALAALMNPSVPAPDDVVRRLAVTELFVLLLPVDDGVHVWSLSWTAQQHRFVPMTRQRLQQAVAAIRKSTDLDTQLPAFALEQARWLGEQLLGPLQGAVRQARHMVVAAGSELGSVPFAALPVGPAGTAAEAGEPWLIRSVAVSQVPSAGAWLAIQRLALTDRPQGHLLAWGDPSFDGRAAAAGTSATRRLLSTRSSTLDTASVPRYSDLPPLPETRDELLAIAASVKADPAADVVLGAAATRDSVLRANAAGLLAQRKVIAFATHGLMAGDLPNLNQPALALSATPDAETNPLAPLLTLDDVLGLRLNADWVVLSACNTAAADGRAEEALSGLARGFFFAGARSVLVTHWAVETESAKLLTTRTFEHFTANPYAGKAESLRQAMLSVMAMPKYQHPAFWAPYTLVGDGAR